MLGKQVAGSPWLNTRHLQKDLTHLTLACSQARRKHVHAKQKSKPTCTGKIGEKLGGKTDTIFRHMLRRESNPGLLSEGRGAACQKC